MAQILLVEDDRTIRMALEYALTGAGYAVNTATDGRSGLEAARQGCDLILLDVMLPSLSGLEVARVLRSEGHTEPIIMLTALNQDHDKVAGLDAGADDYITKPFSVTELLARIRANLRRAERTGEHEPAVIEAGELVIDTRAARVSVAGEPVKLRSKEYGLLVAMARRAHALCTRQWLTQEVWGETFLSTSRTIDTHVRRLRKAIDGHGWTYIQTEHGMGYRFEPKRQEERS